MSGLRDNYTHRKACAHANSAGTTEPLASARHFAVQYNSGRISLFFLVDIVRYTGLYKIAYLPTQYSFPRS